MSRYLVVTPGYPSEEKKYNNAFVHARIKNYIKAGLNVEVFSYSKNPFARPQNGATYVYDTVTVEQGNISELKNKLKTSKYDKVLIHFAIKSALSCVLNANPNTPVIVWCHGVDVIAWHRRLYNLRFANIVKFTGYAVLNTFQRIYLHWIAKQYEDRITFVFVSQWLKKIMEKDIWRVNQIKNYHIIPNVVDDKVFTYYPKDPKDRLKILSIRSFNSRNYANDQTVKAIQLLAEKPYFNELSFTLCGDGRLWKSTVAPLMDFRNVTLCRRFFSHKEIVQLHREHGVILMPSRQDTHGVSTCEAMCSGLVPISSNNSAIPEYIPATCGYLATSIKELASAIDDIYYNPDKFLKYSINSAFYIRNVCGNDIIISKEINLIED